MSAVKSDLEATRKGSVTAVEITDAHGRRRTIDVAELNEADLQLAEQFGYHPVFKREFGWLSTFSFAVSISGLFATVTTTFYYPIFASGLAAAVWCWAIAGVGCLMLAFSVAELISAYPTSGGLYYTISRMAPPAYVPIISWITGYLNLIGQIAGVASSEYGSAQLILAVASMATDFSYLPTTGQTIGVMAGLTIICGIINSMNTYWMEKLTKTYVIFHIIVLISCCISLLVVTPTKNSASTVFTYIPDDNPSGWTPKGFSFLFGFLSVAWTMTDYDATAHIVEEIKEPEVKAPYAVAGAMIFTYVAGFLFNIVLAFCAGDPADLLASPMAQPVAQLFYNSLGKAGGIAFTLAAFIVLQFVCFSAEQALSRTVFAFARDNLLPLSRVWTIINPVTQTPLYAVWMTTIFCLLINLIGLGSYAAISGVFNITAAALDLSYIIPIAVKVIWPKNFKPGPFHLGVASKFVNSYAVIWVIFVTIIFMFPTYSPATNTPDTMNYASVFLFFILTVATIWWFIRGRKVYTGPIMQADLGGMSGQPNPSGEKLDRGSESNGSQDLDRKHE